MNKVKITLTEEDIRKAMLKYLKEKYPNLDISTLYIEYNKRHSFGQATGYLK